MARWQRAKARTGARALARVHRKRPVFFLLRRLRADSARSARALHLVTADVTEPGRELLALRRILQPSNTDGPPVSLELLRENRQLPHFRTWRSAVAGRMGADTRPLTSLVPMRGAGLDLLALMGDVPSVDHAVDNLLHAPVSRLRREFEGLHFHPGHLPWVKRVSEGDRGARGRRDGPVRAGRARVRRHHGRPAQGLRPRHRRRPSRLISCASVRQPVQLVRQGFGDGTDAAV
ncbi:hypothetical protein M2283_009069 [Streptomyces pseudovenezuelae]|uniref:Uncharacterized protein n=1 Tax=Streptomyces pseudovenezuelae TaxID=67350 RepID=A0ABT6LZH3_9ACTN|nr:hypothetical protein [Streptomyces pseudovenezuelae]